MKSYKYVGNKNKMIYFLSALAVLLFAGIIFVAFSPDLYRNIGFKLAYSKYAIFATPEKMNALNDDSVLWSKREHIPITIVLHGAGAEYYRDVFGTVVWLREQGIPAVSFDYDYKDSPEVSVGKLKQFVETILQDTQTTKVNIYGICLGGIIAKDYAYEFDGAKNIDHLVTVISPAINGKPLAHYFNKLFSFDPDPWMVIIGKLENINPVEKHAYFYCMKDLLVPNGYQHAAIGNYVPMDCGHAFINVNPELLSAGVRFMEDRYMDDLLKSN